MIAPRCCSISVMPDPSATKPSAAQLWKMPPIIKVYEAIGTIGDGRVRIIDEQRATVGSSDGSKSYDVEWSPDTRELSANDNASYWRGYLGYPAIAVLIARNVLKVRTEAADALRGIPWKELNRRFRNDYTKTLAAVDEHLSERNIDPADVRKQCEVLLKELNAYAPIHGTRRRPPRQ